MHPHLHAEPTSLGHPIDFLQKLKIVVLADACLQGGIVEFYKNKKLVQRFKMSTNFSLSECRPYVCSGGTCVVMLEKW
jgi:hypothetical protein